MNGNGPAGFWSYAHRDNELDGGRIVRLAKSIGNAFELITGEELAVFVDKDDIAWGDSWRARIDLALSGVTFLIPVITPKFFMSQECRREVLAFSGQAASLGLDDLLLPIHYVDVPPLTDGPSSDEVMSLIARRQWVDWRDLRLEDEGSQRYRRAINDLASRIKQIIDTAQVAPILSLPAFLRNPGSEAENQDEPGFLDVMAEAEIAMPKWAETLLAISEVTREIGEKAQQATVEMGDSDAHGGGFAGRLAAAHHLKDSLEDPISRYVELSSKYSTELVAIDPGILAIIRLASEGGLAGDDAQTVRDFFAVILGLVEASRETFPKLEQLLESVKIPAQQSSVLRSSLNKLQSAIRQVIDGREIIDEWGRLIGEIEAA
ncbi:toll/interleukin-1 receptor domain-containing protein [Kitasatospora sp. NPDC058184]|uniref:toll/interleukin-1 receptor domain-containing protein n=1 Tax=Kitasatospora sp. NPDC058184 TaxID=3346370 RepID=UPI0036DBC1DF